MKLKLPPSIAAPPELYRRLNHLLWLNRLPSATILLIEDNVIPKCRAVSIQDDLFVKPVIFLNTKYKHWAKSLVHEMVHIAEPRLEHGLQFDSLVNFHWRIACSKIRGLRGL